MTKRLLARDVDLRGFTWRLAALQPAWDVAAQQAAAELARREGEHATLQKELDRMRDAYMQQLPVLGYAAAIEPLRQRHALLYLAQALQRLKEQQSAVDVCEASVAQAQRTRIAAQQRLDSLLRLHDDAVALYVTKERHRTGKEADQAWLAGLTRLSSQRARGAEA